MFTEEVTKTLGDAALESWPYPRVFQALKEAGVRYYETDVLRYRIEYVGDTGSYVESGPVDFGPLTVGHAFDEEAIQAAIRRAQEGEMDYPSFLNALAAAGVPRYRVDMTERTVTYYGVGNNLRYVQKVPAWSI